MSKFNFMEQKPKPATIKKAPEVVKPNIFVGEEIIKTRPKKAATVTFKDVI